MSLLRGLPIDLLPDRAVETVEAWLRDHPSIEVVSRDGSSEYASAIKKGAPQAKQVSDRWHLVKNLAACVSVQLTHSLAQLRRAEQAKAKALDGEHSPSERPRPARTRAVQQAQQARQDERSARYEQIIQLRKHGMKNADIAAHVGMSQRTIRGWRETVETFLILALDNHERVSLIRTNPTFWSVGIKGVVMDHNWKGS